MKYYVYIILDPISKKVKIGKATNVEERRLQLQTGNPNLLETIKILTCNNEKEAFDLEKMLHYKFSDIRGNGEWFEYVPQFHLDEFLTSKIIEKRKPLIIESLYGPQVIRDVNDFPRCFFYPWLVAQIKEKYEKSTRLKLPFRTMRYPTDGKQMLYPYSLEYDRVLISGKKHLENLKYDKFLNKKYDLFQKDEEEIKEHLSTLESHFGA